MAAANRPAGFWQSVRQLPERTPLRVKLITAVLALVAIALAVISVAGIGFLQSYLLGQQDNNLAAIVQSHQPVVLVQNYIIFGQQHTSPQGAIDWIDPSGAVHVAVQPTASAFVTNPPDIPGPHISANAGWLSSGGPVTVASTSGGGRWRVIAFSATLANRDQQQVNGIIVVGVDVTGVYGTLGKLTAVDLIVSGILLFGLLVVGVAVVRSSLRPLTEIERTAGAIAAGDLTRRIPELDPRTEVGRLARSLNTMLGQIETAFRARSDSESAARRSEERMRQFVADASHELRTPLTAIRGFAEYYRQRGGIDTGAASEPTVPEPAEATVAQPAEAHQEYTAAAIGLNGTGKLAPTDLDRIMRRVEQESARMGVLVEDMLLLARLDQQRPLDRRTVDLLTLAADAVHDARVVAPDRSINLTVGAGAALLVNGDEVRLRQVVGNLMSNALAHTPIGTPIDVHIRSGSLAEVEAATGAPDSIHTAAGTAAPSQAAAVLEVTDQGPGLTKEQAEHAFERFYRADQARTPGGTGLGLAIVAALVSAHGGAVWVRSQPGKGATFSIALPLAPEAVEEASDHHDDSTDEATEDSGLDQAPDQARVDARSEGRPQA
jgi:two-component system OmpR family sensor kinase